MKFRASRQLSVVEIFREGDVQFFPMVFHYRDQDTFGVRERLLGFAIGRVEEENVGFFDLFGFGIDSDPHESSVYVAFFGRLFEVNF